jgi:uncharacterized membrane protein
MNAIDIMFVALLMIAGFALIGLGLIWPKLYPRLTGRIARRNSLTLQQAKLDQEEKAS